MNKSKYQGDIFNNIELLQELVEKVSVLDSELRDFFKTKKVGIPVELAASWLEVSDLLKLAKSNQRS